MTKFLVEDSGILKALAYLGKAMPKDKSRPILATIHVRKDGIMEAADGFRVHQVRAVESESVTGMQPGLYEVMPKAKNVLVEADSEEIGKNATFPDCDQLMPKQQRMVEFYVNPAYLIDALTGLEKGSPARISFGLNRDGTMTQPIQVQGHLDSGHEVNSVVSAVNFPDVVTLTDILTEKVKGCAGEFTISVDENGKINAPIRVQKTLSAGHEVSALVMPMHSGDGKNAYWRSSEGELVKIADTLKSQE